MLRAVGSIHQPYVVNPQHIAWTASEGFLTAGMQNITNTYQRDLDYGVFRDSGYIYGPKQPRSVYLGVNVRL